MAARRHAPAALIALVIIAGLGLLVVEPGLIAPADDAYDRTTVVLEDANETVEVRIADTARTRYVGLSATESLAAGEGMLFVHDTEKKHTYVMRDMDFPIDIIFIDANGTVTSVHHAPVPEQGQERDSRYTGTGKYVLEVPKGYANETGIRPGDSVRIGER